MNGAVGSSSGTDTSLRRATEALPTRRARCADRSSRNARPYPPIHPWPTQPRNRWPGKPWAMGRERRSD
eukprot:7383373-Pyramimonas_sp.AAC.2